MQTKPRPHDPSKLIYLQSNQGDEVYNLVDHNRPIHTLDSALRRLEEACRNCKAHQQPRLVQLDKQGFPYPISIGDGDEA